MNNFAMTLVLAVCTLAAMPRARAASCVDSDECADLGDLSSDLCGRTVLGQNVSELCPVTCKQCAPAVRAARSTTPTISTNEGNVKLQAANVSTL